jgi:hypothetical protein
MHVDAFNTLNYFELLFNDELWVLEHVIGNVNELCFWWFQLSWIMFSWHLLDVGAVWTTMWHFRSALGQCAPCGRVCFLILVEVQKSRQAFWTLIWLKQSLSDPFLIYHLLSLSNQIRVLNALQLTKKFYRVFFTHKRSCGNFFHRKYNSTWSLISELHPYYV